MEYIHPSQIGELLRKRRKELGLRLEDLADDFISPSTISNIERGITYVNEEKVRYIADKLGVNLEQIHELWAKEKQEEEQMELKLAAVESIVDLMNPDKGLEKLRKLAVPNNHLSTAYVHFLRGKIYLQKKNWVKSQNHFLEAIRIVDQKGEWQKSNIKAASYHELGRIAMEVHDADQALKYVEEGIEHFQEAGERSDYKSMLLAAKVKVLEKLDRIEEGLRLIEDLWQQIDEIKNVEVVLNLSQSRVSMLTKLKLYDEAVSHATAGIELARINKKPEHASELWMMLGGIHLRKGQWDEAEDCFRTALCLQEKIKADELKIKTHTYLWMVLLEQGKSDEAKQVLEEAVAICERNHQTMPHRETYIVLGDCHAKQGAYSDAIQVYEKVWKMARKKGDKPQEHKVILKLARCYEQQDKEKFAEFLQELYRVENELDLELDVPY
jgi:tetratricopeptide (TPR) repeat protein